MGARKSGLCEVGAKSRLGVEKGAYKLGKGWQKGSMSGKSYVNTVGMVKKPFCKTKNTYSIRSSKKTPNQFSRT